MKRNKRKNINRFVSFVLIGLMALGLAACGNASIQTSGGDSDKLSVVTTIFPEYDWVREIAGMSEGSVDKSAAEKIDLTMLLDNGIDLHSFQPTAADIAKISTCDIFIYVGGESDGWVKDALQESKNKEMVVIDLLEVLGENVKEEEVVEGMEEESNHDHEEADEDHEHEEADEDHDHEEADEDGHHHEEGEIEYDEHVWLSLKNTGILVDEIAAKLIEKDPENKNAYQANLDAYKKNLQELDGEYEAAVKAGKVDTLLFGDRFPFRYMTDDYSLKYYAAFVGCSAETEASFETIVFLAGKIDELNLPAICTIENSDGKIAETVKENTKSKDQEILKFDSFQATTSKDVENGVTYLGVMKDNLEVLKKALGN